MVWITRKFRTHFDDRLKREFLGYLDILFEDPFSGIPQNYSTTDDCQPSLELLSVTNYQGLGALDRNPVGRSCGLRLDLRLEHCAVTTTPDCRTRPTGSRSDVLLYGGACRVLLNSTLYMFAALPS